MALFIVSFGCVLILFHEIILSYAVPSRPNIVWVLMDDQDLILGGTAFMPKLKRLLKDEGVTLTNVFCSTPVCCPSRASFYTGQHIHNLYVKDNSLEGNCSSREYQQSVEPYSVSVYLQQNGYRTGFMGKYLNQYGSTAAGSIEHIPQGWDTWVGLVGNSVYYNYTLSVNGAREDHQDSPTHDYLPNVLLDKARKFLDVQHRQPFFLLLSPPTCHDPHQPEPRYADYFLNRSNHDTLRAPRTPNYGKSYEEKHWLVQQQGKSWIEDAARRSQLTDWQYLRRIQSLLTIDDMLLALVEKLDDIGQLENTYILYTSDNGYHLGQFGALKDKRYPYETDIRIPGYIRGPGLAANKRLHTVVVSVDFVPTIFELAGLYPLPSHLDGRSFLPDLAQLHIGHNSASEPPSLGRTFLVDYHGEGSELPPPVCRAEWTPGMACWEEGLESLPPIPWFRVPLCSCQDAKNNTYTCLRTVSEQNNILYCEFGVIDSNDDSAPFIEYYNMDSDFWQEHNLASQLGPQQKSELRLQLHTLRHCKGQTCIVLGGSLPVRAGEQAATALHELTNLKHPIS